MRAKHGFMVLCLILGFTAAASAQRTVGPSGGFSSVPTQNQALDTSNLSTPLPKVPSSPRRFTLGSLIPSWLIPGSKKQNTNIVPGMTGGQ